MNTMEQDLCAVGREFSRNSNAYASLPSFSTPTKPGGRCLTQQTTEPERFGLSHSLSSESIRQACAYYDEPSDEDLIEVQQTPQSFQQQQQQQQPQQQQLKQPQQVAVTTQPISFKMIRKGEEEEESDDDDDGGKEALCTPLDQMDYDDNVGVHVMSDEALDVLNELDAILDVHSGYQMNGNSSASGSDDDKVEDYLMDLDNYLEEMDNALSSSDAGVGGGGGSSNTNTLTREPRTRTLPLSRKRKQNMTQSSSSGAASPAESGMDFQRNHQLRKTFSCGLGSQPTKSTTSVEINTMDTGANSWLRQSMRRAMSDNEPIADETKANIITPVAALPPPPPPSLLSHGVMSSNSEMRRCFSHSDCQPPSPTTTTLPPRPVGMLTEAHIFDSLLQNEQRSARASSEECERPRQFGRRMEGHPRLSALVHSTNRPQSAPAPATARIQMDNDVISWPQETAQIVSTCSELSSVHSSRMHSPVSLASSSSDSSTATPSSPSGQDQQLQQTTTSSTAPLEPENLNLRLQQQQPREKCGFNSVWPHAGSRSLALIGCTLGVFNLCRFAVLTINYGGNFLLQFLLLSIVFGIPLLWLQMCLGAKIKAGPVSMWKISPICCGIGIALVICQCFLAIYSTVSVAWILEYLRDVLPMPAPPAPAHNVYRWQELAFPYRFYAENATGNLTHTVAEYFNVVVLQRRQFANYADGTNVRFNVNDRLAFYLALIWAAVFLILCKGLKSLGKWAFLIYTLPLMALLVVTAKFVHVVQPANLQNIFGATDLDDFLTNSHSWAAATQETFLTWGLLGASVIAIVSRTHANAGKATLRRDAIFLVLLTFIGLGLSALLALCCAQILRQNGYVYIPGSFETPESCAAVFSLKGHINPQLVSYPSKLRPHYSSFIGETYPRHQTIAHHESGFQALRFITEIFPAVLSLASDTISPVWAAVAFGMFAGFGLAQLCVMWKPISSALGNSTSSVLLSCVTGLLLSIPFATEMGISILYYLDYLLGGSWFIPIIWTSLIFGVFLIRGRPYNGDDLVNDLHMCGSMSAFLALSWNVLLPIGLITLSVLDYKASLSNQFYYWRGKAYFSYWMRKTGSLIQIGILLVMPITAIIQIYRYLTHGPADILERIQLLYRPSDEPRRTSTRHQRDAQSRRDGTNQQSDDGQREAQNDAPPKYTPPPSYTTATGARLAKLLRQSIRRSVRRVLGGDSSSRARPILTIDAESPAAANGSNAPPAYLTILSHPAGANSSESQADSSPESIEIDSYAAHRTNSLGRKRPAPTALTTAATLQRPYTAEDVVTILRSSVRNRQSRNVGAVATLPRQPAMSTHMEDASFRSIENLVLNAEPLDQTPGVELECTQNNTSVI